MARNRYPGYCYCCGAWVPVGFGHFEYIRAGRCSPVKWRIKCVKCASGRIVKESDSEVARAKKLREEADRAR